MKLDVVYEPDSKPVQLKMKEDETEPLPLEINNEDRLSKTHDLYCFVESLKNRNPYHNSSSKSELWVEENEVFTDKSVTECYNHDVKDICVDEGVISTDTILFEDGGKDELVQNSDTDESESSDSPSEKLNDELGLFSEIKSSEVSGDDNQYNLEVEENVDLIKETENSECPVLDEPKCSEENARVDDTEVDLLLEISNHDSISSNPTLNSAAEGSNNSSDELSDNNKAESGSITLDLDTSTPTTISEETEGSHNGGGGEEPPLLPPSTDAVNVSRHEDDNTCSDHDLKVLRQIQRDEGESSFAPFSGSIMCSEPIAYSGSLSIRSDSSATSTRSFAFPILATEWNSSPVRMVKADRRRFRKYRLRGWRQGLLCCRF